MLPALDNAELKLPHTLLGISLYELSHGAPPRKSFNWKPLKSQRNAKKKLNPSEAKDIVNSLIDAYKLVQDNLMRAQEKNRSDANKKRVEENFNIGDMVWLLTYNLKNDRPSR